MFVSVCCWVSVDESKYSFAMASARYTGSSFSLRGQAWGHPGQPEGTMYSLRPDLYAPLLTVDVTLHSCLVPPLTLLGLEPMLHSAAQMESICEGLGIALGRSGYCCDA